ncbi:exported protein of unknown function [Streptomyces murinus]
MQLRSTPTATLVLPPCSIAPIEPSVSASTAEAPPCSSPYGWVLPSTGIVPTTFSADASRICTPIRMPRSPAEKSAGRSTPSAAYSSMTSCGNCTCCCSPMSRLRSSYTCLNLSERSVGRRLFQTAFHVRLQAYDHRLAGRGVAGVGGRVQRHQHIGLRVVRRRAAPGRRVEHHPETGRPPLHAVPPLAHQIHVRPLGEPERTRVLGVHQHHPAAARDAPVAVVQAVDRGVVLVVRAQRLQQQPPLGQFGVLHRRRGEVRLAGGGRETALVARRVRQRETAGPGHPRVEVPEPRDHPCDPVADGRVVLLELLPRHHAALPEHRARHPAHDRRLGQQMRARGRQPAARGVHHAHGVLDGHELLAARLLVALGAAQGGQDQRPRAGDRVRAVQLGRHMHRQPRPPHCRLGHLGVRGRGDEVAAHGEEHLRLAVAQRADRPYDVEAVLPGRREPELPLQGVQEGGRGPLEDAHRAVALHVRMTAHRAHARARPADVAAQQQEVDDLADRRHGVLVLGQTHRPAHDGPLGGEHQLQRPLDLRAAQTGRGQRLVPVGGLRGLGELLESMRVFAHELLVDRAVRRQDQLVEEPEERLVAADADLEEQIGERGALEHALRGLRVLEPLQARLGQRVDADHLRAVRLGLLQRGQHPGMVGARVLARHDDQIGLVQVLQEDAALADADGLRQRRARRLVAHVRAVRQVVRAQLAREELVQERRLVAGTARGVEDGLVRGGEGGDLLGDDAEGALPGDRLVVRRPFGEVHGVGEPPLLAQPVPAPGRQVGDGVRGEELRGDPAQGGLLGHRLRAVLAELRGVPVLRLRPGAAGAVEAVLLVHPQQRQRGAPDPHLLLGDPQGVPDGRQPRRRVLRLRDLRRVLHRITLGRLRRHRALPFDCVYHVRGRSSHGALTGGMGGSSARREGRREGWGVSAGPRREGWGVSAGPGVSPITDTAYRPPRDTGPPRGARSGRRAAAVVVRDRLAALPREPPPGSVAARAAAGSLGPGPVAPDRVRPAPSARPPEARAVRSVSGAWQDRWRGRDSIEEDRQDPRRLPSPADAHGRALAGLPRVLRAARGELHHRDGPADERDLRFRVDAGQHPA